MRTREEIVEANSKIRQSMGELLATDSYYEKTFQPLIMQLDEFHQVIHGKYKTIANAENEAQKEMIALQDQTNLRFYNDSLLLTQQLIKDAVKFARPRYESVKPEAERQLLLEAVVFMLQLNKNDTPRKTMEENATQLNAKIDMHLEAVKDDAFRVKLWGGLKMGAGIFWAIIGVLTTPAFGIGLLFLSVGLDDIGDSKKITKSAKNLEKRAETISSLYQTGLSHFENTKKSETEPKSTHETKETKDAGSLTPPRNQK